jgi:pimeloyl-ACP methyl ester carboxylesterase
MSIFEETVFECGDGLHLHYSIGPSHGPPIVLLHGVLRSWKDFAPLLTELSLRHQIFALDFRGHGESNDDADGNYRVVDYVEDALAFVREIVPKPAIVYGHSLGAMVAAAVAARAPQRVRGLILEDPPFETMGSRIHETSLGGYFRNVQRIANERLAGTRQQIAEALASIPMEDRPGITLGDLRDGVSLRFSAACLQQIDPRVLVPIVEAKWLEGYDLKEVTSQINTPTLVFQADAAVGGMLCDEDALTLRRTIEDCVLIQFPNTGHLIHWTDREATLQHTIGFIEASVSC